MHCVRHVYVLGRARGATGGEATQAAQAGSPLMTEAVDSRARTQIEAWWHAKSSGAALSVSPDAEGSAEGRSGAAVGRLDVSASPPPGSTSEGVVYGHVSRVIDFQARPQFFLHTSLPPFRPARRAFRSVHSSELFSYDSSDEIPAPGRGPAGSSSIPIPYGGTPRHRASGGGTSCPLSTRPPRAAYRRRVVALRRRLLWRERPAGPF